MSEQRNGIVHESQNILWKCCSINQHTHAIIQMKAFNFELNFLSIKKMCSYKYFPLQCDWQSIGTTFILLPHVLFRGRCGNSSATFSLGNKVWPPSSVWEGSKEFPELLFQMRLLLFMAPGRRVSEELLYNVIVGARSLVSWEPDSCSRFLTHRCKWRHLFNTSHKTQALSAGAKHTHTHTNQNI